jgi:hypothetical protein
MDAETFPDTNQPDSFEGVVDHKKDQELAQRNGLHFAPVSSQLYPSAPVEPLRPDQVGGFAKPRRILGKVTSLPGSIVDVSFRLENRMTSWGRGPAASVRYPESKDTRIPAYGLEVTFWKPNIEQMIQANEDWLQVPDVQTIISTKTRNYIYVNGVKLRSTTPERDGFYFGKLYSGDIVTIYQQKDQYLKLKVEIFHGLHAKERPEEEKPFVIETTLKRDV